MNEKTQESETDIEQLGVKSAPYNHTELVIGLVTPIGTETGSIIEFMKTRLGHSNYETVVIEISKDVIRKIENIEDEFTDKLSRFNTYIDAGNRIRKNTGSNGILALGAMDAIMELRKSENPYRQKTAYIIKSLKQPEEVLSLRNAYGNGFFLFVIASDEKQRLRYLTDDLKISENDAINLLKRDFDESFDHGQHTEETFHLSDFFIDLEDDKEKTKQSIWRIFDLLFGKPHITPTFDEYAMFMAFSTALRSADLSRQVGAVIAKNNEILAYGANDCPKAGGGLYWPIYDPEKKLYDDIEKGRDYKRNCDSNKIAQQQIVSNILEAFVDACQKAEDSPPECLTNECQARIEAILEQSEIGDLTEFGRIVHAEMEALSFCARNNISSKHSTLYCTTFPCHNCAKHIVASGITKVVYVEPYPKSRAFELFDDSICAKKEEDNDNRVEFTPFIGVGPRKFFDLFSMKLSSGYNLKRKHKDGKIFEWNIADTSPRMKMVPVTYIQREAIAVEAYNKKIEPLKTGRIK